MDSLYVYSFLFQRCLDFGFILPFEPQAHPAVGTELPWYRNQLGGNSLSFEPLFCLQGSGDE
jgi:hypothetical protein